MIINRNNVRRKKNIKENGPFSDFFIRLGGESQRRSRREILESIQKLKIPQNSTQQESSKVGNPSITINKYRYG